MENLIYWQGKPVGREMGSYTTFFPSAPAEAIAALSPGRTATRSGNTHIDSVLAALNAQMEAIPELTKAVEELIQKRAVPA